MENERSNVWVWILWIVIRENYAIWLKHFVYWGKSNLAVTENSLMSLGVRKKMYQIKWTPLLSVTLWMKGTKILNLNLLKFDCQNLPFRRSLASSKLKPFLFPQELKFNLETTSKTVSQDLASFCTFVSWKGRGSFSVKLPEVYELCGVVQWYPTLSPEHKSEYE